MRLVLNTQTHGKIFLMRSYLMVLGLSVFCHIAVAQTSGVDYAVSRQPVAGIVLPPNQAPILYQGGFEAADNGFLPPVQLEVVQRISSLVPLQGSNASSTLATWYDEFTGKQYVLEATQDCNTVITPIALHSYDRSTPSQVDVIAMPDLFISDNPETGIVVNGDLYLILRDDYILAGNLSDPLNVIRHDLAIQLPSQGMQRYATLPDGSIQFADGNTVYKFTSRNAPTVQTFQEQLLGLGISENDELLAFATTEVYVIDANGQSTTYAHNQAGFSFSSFAIAPQNESFICTYFTPTGEEFFGTGSFENGTMVLEQNGEVDLANRAYCMKYAAEDDRQLGVLGYVDHDTKLVVYSPTGELAIQNDISVALMTADVSADVAIDQGRDTTVARITYTPVVTNTSDVVIERLDFDASKLRPWFCRTSSGLVYEDLALQPGETRQLEPITVYGFDYLPATNAEVTLQLNAANNLPIKPGIPRSFTEYPLLVGTSSAFAKTLSVWPNPASEYLHVDASDLGSITTVLVSDVLGKTHAVSLKNGQVDVAHLPKGHYTLVLVDQTGAAARSVFVKE